MFKIGEKVVSKKNSMFDEVKSGCVYTITFIREEARDDSNYLCKVNNSVGMYSANFFESYNIYCRRDKINKLKSKLKKV
jgi:hypothetical protein